MKKNKVLKILLIVILVVLFLLGCFTIYKFIIINKIFNKMSEYVLKDNYYMEIKNATDDTSVSKIYYKNGIGKMLISERVYSWTDGKEAYLIDEEKKQYQEVEKNSSLLISNEYVGSMIPGYSRNLIEKFFLAGNLNTSIRKEKYNNLKYYVITTIENKIKKTIWIQYNTLIPTQASVEIDGVKTSLYYDINFDKTMDKEIEKPNLEEYTLTE